MPLLQPARKENGKFLNPVETRVGGIGMIFKVMRQYLTNKEERVPRRPLGPFLTDAAIYKQLPASGLRITWMGHSSMLLEIDGARLLVDPVWDERASPFSWAGPKRFFAPPISLDKIPAVDAILLSHNHYDHLGARTVQALTRFQPNAPWVTSSGVGAQLRRFGVTAQVTELNWTQSAFINQINITACPARHFSGRGLRDRYKSLWSSFVITGPRHKIYYGADSGLWNGFSAIASQYGPFDLTMLEIGAYNDLWKSIHMGPDGAVQAFADMGGRGLLMPIHWGLFDLALHSWRQPIQRMTELADASRIKLWSPPPGVPTDLISGQECRSNWWRAP